MFTTQLKMKSIKKMNKKYETVKEREQPQQNININIINHNFSNFYIKDKKDDYNKSLLNMNDYFDDKNNRIEKITTVRKNSNKIVSNSNNFDLFRNPNTNKQQTQTSNKYASIITKTPQNISTIRPASATTINQEKRQITGYDYSNNYFERKQSLNSLLSSKANYQPQTQSKYAKTNNYSDMFIDYDYERPKQSRPSTSDIKQRINSINDVINNINTPKRSTGEGFMKRKDELNDYQQFSIASKSVERSKLRDAYDNKYDSSMRFYANENNSFSDFKMNKGKKRICNR